MPMQTWLARFAGCLAAMTDYRRLRNGMLVWTVLGGLLMLPPLVYVFNQDLIHFGIPQIVLYLFALWLLLIIGTAAFAHAMPRDRGHDDGED